jgi:hypothetical protein
MAASLSYRGLDALPRRNLQIDDAALAAGRNPAAIRRLLDITGTFAANGVGYLNGPPTQCEELSELATVHGTSTFILCAADPDAIQRFAHEVAPPGVRERVAEFRG